jgi:hypothetical protein
MRLSSFEEQSIITKKGGDIDLYIETTTKEYDYIKVLELNAKSTGVILG